jgi:hypothetical protein
MTKIFIVAQITSRVTEETAARIFYVVPGDVPTGSSKCGYHLWAACYSTPAHILILQ